MGCTYSDLPSDAGDGFTFRVYNVDGQGVKLNPGKIKVAASHLVLYQKGKEAIRWPLRCLRRYGFDEELFSFECGRRCQTGPGIYAFKCRQAEELFVLVQESIQRAGQEDQMRALANGGGSGSSGGSHAMFTPHPASSAAAAGTPHNLAFSQPPGFSAATGSSPASTLGRTSATRPPSSHHHHHHHHQQQEDEHNYMNGALPSSFSSDSPQYINTGPRAGAFPIEESSPLINFMTHGYGAGGVGGGGRSQVNYAVILPSSMENLLDEEGQDAVSNFPPSSSCCPMDQHPPDFPSAVGGGSLRTLGPDDVQLQDCDVFLDAGGDDCGGGAFPNYINIGVNDDPPASAPPPPPPPIICCSDEAGSASTEVVGVAGAENGLRAGAKKSGGGLGVDPAAGSMPNYANLLIHGSSSSGGAGAVGGAGSSQASFASGTQRSKQQQQQQQQHTSHYLVLDLNPAPPSDNPAGGAGAVPSQSPTSPISSSVSVPESSSSYAKIDFNKTEALSHSSRAGTNGEDEPGARKTRHNSTIGM